MKFKLLITGFILSVLALAGVGVYALYSNQRLLVEHEAGHKHFNRTAMAATEASSYAKRAEGHLHLYLMLHREADKKKYPARIASLNEQIAILDEHIANAKARELLDKIMEKSRDLPALGQELIDFHDRAMQETGKCDLSQQCDLISELHDRFSTIRSLGVEINAQELTLESELKASLFIRAKHTQSILILLTSLAFITMLWLGAALSRLIRRLNEENTIRIQSEKKLADEKEKLQAALTKVKTLSGLLPICSICKQVRDDQGYWNQIEYYIKQHSNAEFTHGICPECAKKHYPEFEQKPSETETL